MLGKSATIRKCDLHEIVELDLDKKTYRIVDTTPKPDSVPSPAPKAWRRTAPDEAPGTAVLEMTRVVRALGAMLIDGINTQHFQSTSMIAMTQATGSCRDGSYSVARDESLSGFAQPHAICRHFHAPASVYPRQPEQMVARGGCCPAVTCARGVHRTR